MKFWKWSRKDWAFFFIATPLCVALNVLADSQWGGVALALAYVIITLARKVLSRRDFAAYLVTFSAFLCFNTYFNTLSTPWVGAFDVALSGMESWVVGYLYRYDLKNRLARLCASFLLAVLKDLTAQEEKEMLCRFARLDPDEDVGPYAPSAKVSH